MKTPQLLGITLLCSLVLGTAAHRGWSQDAAPPPPPVSRCPLPGWAEGMVKYLAPTAAFPTDDTQNNPTTDCIFHQWSWEAFVWATALDPSTKQPRFLALPNLDALGQTPRPELAKAGPKPLMLKPRTLKPRGSEQEIGGITQAGSQGILVDQNGQAVYYSQHANQTYYQFLQQYYGVAKYAKASPTLNFPLGAAVFKASWRIVAEGEDASTFYTTQAIVPMLANSTQKGGGIIIDPSGKTRTVTVALVGLHVVGVTANHPEFLWGTFEQVRNAPDLPTTVLPPSEPVSTQSFTFYKAGTVASACNTPGTSVSDPAKQTLTPITNVFRAFAYGGENAAGVTEIDSINSQAQGAVKGFPNRPDEAVWANYKLIGTVWLAPNSLKPGDGDLDTEAFGSIALSNATMETFVQGVGTNCFSCHNTGGNSRHNIPGKNINLSHKLLEPLFAAPDPKLRPLRRLLVGPER